MSDKPSPNPQSRETVPGQESQLSRSLTLIGQKAEEDNIQATIQVPLEPSYSAGGLHQTCVVHQDALYEFALDILKQFEESKEKDR